MTAEAAETQSQIPDSDPVATRSEKRRRKSSWLTFLRDILVIILIAVLVSFLVKTFLVRSFYIPSKSMEQTLQINDRIMVDQLMPRFNGYNRGDIVVFRDPGGWLSSMPSSPKDENALGAFVDGVLGFIGLSAPDSDEHLVKRVIGLPGDHVVCCNAIGQITINGVGIDETSYIDVPAGAPASAVEFDVEVPANSYWVLGDNRNYSKDSRFSTSLPGNGFVLRDDMVGRAFVRMWPFDRFAFLHTPDAVFAGVPEPEAAQQ